jgi:hypothetical protein
MPAATTTSPACSSASTDKADLKIAKPKHCHPERTDRSRWGRERGPRRTLQFGGGEPKDLRLFFNGLAGYQLSIPAHSCFVSGHDSPGSPATGPRRWGGFTGCEKRRWRRSNESGHDFSRADKANKMDWASAPERCFSKYSPPDFPSSAPRLAPESAPTSK